jgi:1-acyl-sn-glycerol-3-phosphate acyltransferase
MLLYPIIRIFWRWRVDKKAIKGMKGPMVALANHSSTMDIVFTVLSLLPKRFNIVTGKDLFSWPELRPFITAFGAIAKSQNALDIASLRTMKAAADAGRSILIYPEGKTSLDGRELYFLAPAVGKFIKFLGQPVIMAKSNGAYLAKPRYFKGTRKTTRVQTTITPLLTAEEVKSLPPMAIYERVREALRFNDHLWQAENKVRIRTKGRARNLEYILYKCPKCGAEYEMVSDDTTLTCNHCGNQAEYTAYGELLPVGDSVVFPRIDLWYDYEKAEARKELETEGFHLEKEVTLEINEDIASGSYELRGEGVFFIDRETIGYRGTKDGAEFTFSQSLENLPSVITKNKEGIDFPEGDLIYRFLFKEKKWSSKFGLLVEQSYCVRHHIEG